MIKTPADNDNDATSQRSTPMRIFIFKSESRPNLRAFGGDLLGSRLPKQFSPWRAIRAIAPDRDQPHNVSRGLIEDAIKTHGFQLWRMKKKVEAE
jgi:hypothetical protein